jgi:cellulose synthase/poly-beta-1,6-N-acetylglucosamine synthase-like glycosyltransferase
LNSPSSPNMALLPNEVLIDRLSHGKSMTGSPQVSVVMPVFNAARFVSQAIESILAQTDPDFEFLIFDDGSTDGSIEILNRFAKSDSRVCLHLGEHRGYSAWLNVGVKAARGGFICPATRVPPKPSRRSCNWGPRRID